MDAFMSIGRCLRETFAKHAMYPGGGRGSVGKAAVRFFRTSPNCTPASAKVQYKGVMNRSLQMARLRENTMDHRGGIMPSIGACVQRGRDR